MNKITSFLLLGLVFLVSQGNVNQTNKIDLSQLVLVETSDNNILLPTGDPEIDRYGCWQALGQHGERTVWNPDCVMEMTIGTPLQNDFIIEHDWQLENDDIE